MSKLRLLTLVGLLAAALTPLYGCGNECAEGTTDQDGQCVIAAKGCAEGTVLRDGECLIDEGGCGEGTVLEGSLCVPAEEVCIGDTTFDADARSCVPNTSVLCGDGTELGEDERCVPNADACAEKTRRDDNGRCVIEAAACGEGTELDPTTGRCVLTDASCSDGLAFDADNNTCLPTEDICDDGTRFDADSGMCLNDSCNLGDVLIDGVCMAPADDLAASPDLTETENNDPAFGGTAETLFVGLPGDDPYVFVGTIAEPTDLDADGEVDQDVDVFKFDATAGEWFEITVQSRGLQAPAFIVEGPDDFVRYSPVGRSKDAARQIVAPAEGTYTVTVLPSLLVQSPDQGYAFGGDDWNYVGTLQSSFAPDAAQVDISSGTAQLNGEYPELGDNYFELSGLRPDAFLSVDVSFSGGDAAGLVQVWDDTMALLSETAVASGDSVNIATGGAPTVYVLFDWARLLGPDAQFSASLSVFSRYESTPNASIPDNVLEGVEDVLTVSNCSVVSSVTVDLDITHGYRGDLIVDLTDPSGTTVRLHDSTGGSDDDLIGTYPVDLTPAGNLDDFIGGIGTGDWTLTVGDDAAIGTGTLNSWALNLSCQ